MNCNKSLANSFHADHVFAFSKGGETTTINGQALCATCNLKKGSQ
jgi:5-methylcytosine-specific restriction endonuclease McrA